MFSRMNQVWFAPIDASFLAVFRMMFGALLVFESVNYGIFLCLDCMYRDTDLLFKYHHFEWVVMLPGFGLELVYVMLGVSGIGVILGLFYRVSIVVATLSFCYLFLLDQALYLNHFYLAILFCWILVFVPAHRYWSLDARRNPAIASSTVPAWSRLWLVFQVEIVLIYAGLVKLNSDWLNLEPMRLWMNARSVDEHVFFQWLTQDAGIAVASYGVILLHLIGAPLLLWRKTRLVVFFIYCGFHMINAFVFNIGIFPFMTIASTLILFDPDWPKQFYQWVQSRRRGSSADRLDEKLATASSSINPLGASGLGGTDGVPAFPASTGAGTVFKGLIVTFICLWLVAQAVVPVRHLLLPGEVSWNEAGHRFSWRMKLRSKQGVARFYVVKNGAAAVQVDPASHLNAKQVRKMSCIPDLIWQFAQFLDEQYTIKPADEVEVYVDTNCRLNTREATPLIKRLVDLSAIPRNEPEANWVLPNNKPLPNKFLPI